AVRSMTRIDEASGPRAFAGGASGEIQGALEVIDALGASTEAANGLRPHPGLRPVDHVARVLHLQYREVTLEGSWWKEAAGPLLGRRTEDGTPVALIPRPGGYEAREHREDGVRIVDSVTPEVAATYENVATMFYRPLPPGPGRLRDLARLVATGNLRDLLLVIGVTVATSGLVALVPILTGMIVGTAIPSVERAQLIFIGAMLVAIAISKALVHVVAGIAFLRIETRSSYQVIAALVDRVLQLPASFFRGSSAGDLTQRVMAVEQVRSSLTQSVLSVFVSLVASLSNLGVLFYYDVKMGLTAIGVIVVELIIVAWLSIRMARIDYEMSIAKGELDGFGVDMLLGVRQIRVQGSRDRILSGLLTRLGRVGSFSYRTGMLGVWLGVVVGATSTITLILVFAEFTAGLRSVSGGPALDAGGFVAFVTALSAFLGAVVGIAPAIKAVANMVPQIHRIRPILEAETEIGETGGDVVALRGGVAARGIEFRYGPDLPPVLDGVDIEARPGEFIAIVGRTGCGKSTLLSVLLGLEQPQAGQVLYDDAPMDSLDPAIVRSQVGVVMQSNETLTGNVQSTILGIGSNRTLDDAWAAARLVGMGDEIDGMPMGMLTMITPNSMSQSQLQRLLIARALVGRPEVLFLDEATSALDNVTQAEITKAIDGLGSTRIVIAHRLSTIRNADRIYVLDKGRVVQSGSFDELQSEGGMFAKLMAGQIS
ncbi:MAG: ATP-binding cassette domain-containing protein, partial [Planctomycetota bacterium]|nr:ATP-binding cassette domain-containing protein [Planctomycetota bacterium]